MVKGVSLHDFLQLRSRIEKKGWQFRYSLYLADTKCLFARMLSPPHERLHRELSFKIRFNASRMGLVDELDEGGGTTYETSSAGALTSSGQGDSILKPLSRRPTGHEWPTVVFEAGQSQNMAHLRQKGNWWFHASNHAVRIVILAKMHRQGSRIVLEKWREMLQPPRNGATSTRASSASPAHRPICLQTITITRAAGISDTDPRRFEPASYHVTGGSLVIEFEDLFLRPPVPPLDEGITLDARELQDYAAVCWRAVG